MDKPVNRHKCAHCGKTSTLDHGMYGYTALKCRCDICKKAIRDYVADRRARQKQGITKKDIQ